MRLLIAYAKRQRETGYLSLDGVVIPKPFAKHSLDGLDFFSHKGDKVRSLHIVLNLSHALLIKLR